MPIGGHVVLVKDEQIDSVETALCEISNVTVGKRDKGGICIATESSSREEEKALVEKIEKLPGVESVVLVYYNFEDETSSVPQ